MVKHIKAVQVGSYPWDRFTIYLSVNDVEYIVYDVPGKEYRAYRKQVEYGEGFKAFNVLQSRFKVERRSDSDELSKQIQLFLKDKGG